MTRYLLLGCCLLLIWSCEQPSAPTTAATPQDKAPAAPMAAPQKTGVKLLRTAVTPARFELPSEALQTLSAAIDGGLFSEVVWFFPTREKLDDFSADKGWLDKTLVLLDKARANHPANPFIQLFKVDVLAKAKRAKEALPLLEELQQRDWSPVYYPEMKQQLRQQIEEIQKNSNL